MQSAGGVASPDSSLQAAQLAQALVHGLLPQTFHHLGWGGMGWAQSITIKVASLNADSYSARTGEVAIPERRAGGRYVHVSSRPDLSGVTAAVSLHCGENPALKLASTPPGATRRR